MFESASSKKIAVVTGGAGFLGSHLSDRLIAEGFRVIAIDNLVTGSRDNIAHLAGNQDFKFVRHNVSEFIFIPGRVDYVFHFASPASPIDYLELPIPTVSDLIDGIFRLAMSEYHEPVNIGNPREMTILEFANKILEITGSKSEIIKKQLPEDDPKVRRPDITRARQLLCWEPKVDFESGIRETISYFEDRKAAWPRLQARGRWDNESGNSDGLKPEIKSMTIKNYCVHFRPHNIVLAGTPNG